MKRAYLCIFVAMLLVGCEQTIPDVDNDQHKQEIKTPVAGRTYIEEKYNAEELNFGMYGDVLFTEYSEAGTSDSFNWYYTMVLDTIRVYRTHNNTIYGTYIYHDKYLIKYYDYNPGNQDYKLVEKNSRK